MPLKYWDEAFLTATFLINLLPSKVINLESPTERLLKITPNYDALRTFGCACWPNLRPYNTRKLAFRSKRCVFLGYSPLHKGVKCLDVSTGRVYISRDVVFDENIFPFQELHPNAGALLKKEILLLPSSTSHEVAQTANDSMTTIVPMYVPVVSPQVDAALGEKFAQNGASMPSESYTENHMQSDKTGAEIDEDLEEHSSVCPDPKADSPASSSVPVRQPASPASPARLSPTTSPASTPLPPRGAHRPVPALDAAVPSLVDAASP
jgi:hypothetical protein